jgi:peptide/nickel transport system substrate-binding protein
VDKASVTADTNARNAIWAQIDAKVMDDSYIVPYINLKQLFYRPPGLKNVYVNQGLGGYYDYTAFGVK